MHRRIKFVHAGSFSTRGIIRQISSITINLLWKISSMLHRRRNIQSHNRTTQVSLDDSSQYVSQYIQCRCIPGESRWCNKGSSLERRTFPASSTRNDIKFIVEAWSMDGRTITPITRTEPCICSHETDETPDRGLRTTFATFSLPLDLPPRWLLPPFTPDGPSWKLAVAFCVCLAPARSQPSSATRYWPWWLIILIW